MQPITTISNTIYYNSKHRVFCGHFPSDPIFPGVFYFSEILRLLPDEISCLSYLIKHAKFIKKVTVGACLYYHLSINESNEGNINLFAIVNDSQEDLVAKIKMIFRKSENHAEPS